MFAQLSPAMLVALMIVLIAVSVLLHQAV